METYCLEKMGSFLQFEESRTPYFRRNESSWKFEKLQVWGKAHQFVLEVYKLTGNFPKDEKYGLTNQFRRAAVSIAANIAEGTGKKSIKDFIRFLVISRGSVEECKYFLLLSMDLKYISIDEFKVMKEVIDQTGRLLNGLITSLERKANPSNH